MRGCERVAKTTRTRRSSRRRSAVHSYVARRSRHHIQQRGVYRLRKLVPPSLSCQPTTPRSRSLPAHAAAARRWHTWRRRRRPSAGAAAVALRAAHLAERPRQLAHFDGCQRLERGARQERDDAGTPGASFFDVSLHIYDLDSHNPRRRRRKGARVRQASKSSTLTQKTCRGGRE